MPATTQFVSNKPKVIAQDPKTPTQQVTYKLFAEGHSVEDIAEMRFLSPITIMAHLVQLYEPDAAAIDIFQVVSAAEIQQITEGVSFLPEPLKLREVYEFFGEEFSYDKIRFALAFRNKTHLLHNGKTDNAD